MGDRLRAAAVLIVLIAGAPSVPAAAQPPRDPGAFAVELQQLAGEISTATPEAAVVLAKTVPAVWQVEHRSRRYDVPAGWLQTALRGATDDAARWPAERSIVVERLTSLAGESRLLQAGGDHQISSEAGAVLARILADPEFARLNRESATARLWQRLVDWFAGILRRLGLGRVAGAATAEAIAWAVSLIALGALVAWLISALRGSQPRTRLAPESPSDVLSARAWARQAAAAEDVREAVRYAYRAAMRRLEEEGVWRVDETRTPREYLRILPRDHRRRTPVTDVARRFEEIWYGARAATSDDRRTLLERLRELECLPAE